MIKSCAFCSSHRQLEIINDFNRNQVTCSGCGAAGGASDTKDGAIANWNMRQVAATPRPQTFSFYCEGECACSQPVIIEEMKRDEENTDAIWGDIVCSVCGFVIATVRVSEPGFYDLVKIGGKNEQASN